MSHLEKNNQIVRPIPKFHPFICSESIALHPSSQITLRHLSTPKQIYGRIVKCNFYLLKKYHNLCNKYLTDRFPVTFSYLLKPILAIQSSWPKYKSDCNTLNIFPSCSLTMQCNGKKLLYCLLIGICCFNKLQHLKKTVKNLPT